MTENPDFFVTYHASVREKGYSRSGAYSEGGPTYPRGEHGSFEIGKVIVDFIHPGTGNRIWRGKARRVVDRHDDNETKIKYINQVVQKIFERFPP